MIRLSMTATLEDAQRSFLRFPLVLLCGVIAAIAAIYLAEGNYTEGPYGRLLLTAILGIPTLLAISLASEQQKWSARVGWVLRLAGLFFVGLYYFAIPREFPASHGIRYAILLAGGHFFVSISPFFRSYSAQKIWKFNIDILLRLLSSVVFTLVVYAGLSLALAAMDQLLGLTVDSDIYLRLFIILVFVFHTWFFLGGIPENPVISSGEVDFPRPLRVFAQNILSTLVVVYLAILMTYLGKIVISGVWPSGWIGWLVSGVAVAGLLSVVLLSPLQGNSDNSWIRVYFRIFHVLMIPSVVMLVLAVSKRINQYGLTELRYLLLILSGWMVVVLITGLWFERIKLRLIPLSLGLLALVISTGPWGAMSMSRHSQMSRIETDLVAAGLFSNGKLVPGSKESTSEDRNDLANSFEYLIRQYGYKELDNWLTPAMGDSLERIADDGSFTHQVQWAQANFIARELGLTPPGPRGTLFGHYDILGDGCFNAVSLNGLQYSLNVQATAGTWVDFQWDNSNCEIGLSETDGSLVLKRDGLLLMEMPMEELLLDLARTGADQQFRTFEDPAEMTFDYATDSLRVRLIVYSVAFKYESQQPLVKDLRGLLLLGTP